MITRGGRILENGMPVSFQDLTKGDSSLVPASKRVPKNRTQEAMKSAGERRGRKRANKRDIKANQGLRIEEEIKDIWSEYDKNTMKTVYQEKHDKRKEHKREIFALLAKTKKASGDRHEEQSK